MPAKCKKVNGDVLFECPGCKCLHSVSVDDVNSMGSRWTWNENVDLPTFSPSVLVTYRFSDLGRKDKICHSFVRDGNIIFLEDSSHELAGKTVELPDFDD